MLGIETLLHLDDVKLRIFQTVRLHECDVLQGGSLFEHHRLEARQVRGAHDEVLNFSNVNLKAARDPLNPPTRQRP